MYDSGNVKLKKELKIQLAQPSTEFIKTSIALNYYIYHVLADVIHDL